MKKAIFAAFLLCMVSTTNLCATVKENAQLFLPPFVIAGAGAIGSARLISLLPDTRIQNLFGLAAGVTLQVGANWATYKINDPEIISLERKMGIVLCAALAVIVPLALDGINHNFKTLQAYDMAIMLGTGIGVFMSLHIFEPENG